MSNRIKVFQPEVFSLSENWSTNDFLVLADMIINHQQKTKLHNNSDLSLKK